MGLYGNKFINVSNGIDLLDTYLNEFNNFVELVNSGNLPIDESAINLNKIKEMAIKVINGILEILKKAYNGVKTILSKFSKKNRKKKAEEIKKKMYQNGNIGDMKFLPDKQFVFESDIAINPEKQNKLVETCQDIQKNLFIYFDSEDFMNEDMEEYKRGITSLSDILMKSYDFTLYAKLDEGILDDEDGMMEIHKKLLRKDCIDAIDFHALTIDFTTSMRNCTATLLRGTAEEELPKLNTANSIVNFLSEYDNDIEVCKDNLEDIQEVYTKLRVTMEKCFSKREIVNGDNGEYLPYRKGKDLKLVQAILRTIKLDAKIVNYLCTIATKSEMIKSQYLEKINIIVSA